MAKARVSVRMDAQAINRVCITASEKSVIKGADRAKRYVQQEIVKAGRVRTGAMLKVQAKRFRTIASSGRAVYRVWSPVRYASWQNDGIGPVFPRKPGGVLRFKPKGSSTYVFARSTRGFKGAHFYEKALRRMSAKDFV